MSQNKTAELKFLDILNEEKSLRVMLNLRRESLFNYDNQSGVLWVSHHLYTRFEPQHCFGGLKYSDFPGFGYDDLKDFLKDVFEKHFNFKMKVETICWKSLLISWDCFAKVQKRNQLKGQFAE